MYPAIIDAYLAPTSVAEALGALGQNPGATIFAGGQSVMQAIKARLVEPTCIVDLNGIAELKGVSVAAGGVTIGPMTRYADLNQETKLHGAYQAICDAATTVADRQVRNRGTIGGSICWNYLAACMPPTVLAMDAQFELTKAGGGTRTVAASDFFTGALDTARDDGELLTKISLAPPAAHAGSAYQKWSTQADGLPIIGVAVYLETDGGGSCTSARLAFGGILPVTRRSPAGEKGLVGMKAGDKDGIGAALQAAADDIDPQGDRWVEGGYRKVLIKDLGRQVVTTAFERAR